MVLDPKANELGPAPVYPRRSKGCPAGVVLVLDSSGSIGERDWKIALQFADGIVRGLRNKTNERLSEIVTWIRRNSVQPVTLKEHMSTDGSPDVVHIAAVVYSTYATTKWDLNERKTTQQLSEDIQKLHYEAGKTNTCEGLQHAEQIFVNSTTVYSKHIVVLLTDGQSNNRLKTIAQAKRMHANGVEIFVIGVGGDINREELDQVSSNTDTRVQHSHYVSSYSSLQGISTKIVDATYTTVEQTLRQADPEAIKMLKNEFKQIIILFVVCIFMRWVNSYVGPYCPPECMK